MREIQDYLETVDDDLEMKREVVINILLIYEEINANVDKLDSTNQPTVAHGHETVIDVNKEKAIIRQGTLKTEMEMLQK